MGVRETVTDRRNVFVEVVARSATEVEATSDALREIGLEIATVVRDRVVEPWNPSEAACEDEGEAAGEGDVAGAEDEADAEGETGVGDEN